jgi:hypothetical protein
MGPRGDRRFSQEDVDSFLAENLEANFRAIKEKVSSLARR